MPATHAKQLTGWGRTSPTAATVLAEPTPESVVAAVRAAGPRGVLARGLGRSYGDAAQNAGGVVVDMTGLDRVHSLDADSGVVVVDAGVSLDTLMRRALPFGLWVPVLPGTRQVTVGGAIAADIHGKNHHSQGSFGNHVLSMDVVTGEGEMRTLTPSGPEAELFWATVGGMGLTGIVLRATLRLQPTQTAYFVVDTERATDIDDLMARLSDNDDAYTYSVAWFDSVSTGAAMGRAVITRGWGARREDLPKRLRRNPLRFDAPQLFTAPPVFPPRLVNRFTARAFNEAWFRKAPALRRGEVQNITKFFHPLDIVGQWNRVYGPRGFLQYQFVVPFGAECAFRQCVQEIAGSGQVSCLNVLKRFGAGNAAPLSFPTPGWTLAVDIPIGPGLSRLCTTLDELVLGAGGRIYLAKDSRVSAETLAGMYPRLDEWRKARATADPHGVFTSDLARRLAL